MIAIKYENWIIITERANKYRLPSFLRGKLKLFKRKCSLNESIFFLIYRQPSHAERQHWTSELKDYIKRWWQLPTLAFLAPAGFNGWCLPLELLVVVHCHGIALRVSSAWIDVFSRKSFYRPTWKRKIEKHRRTCFMGAHKCRRLGVKFRLHYANETVLLTHTWCRFIANFWKRKLFRTIHYVKFWQCRRPHICDFYLFLAQFSLWLLEVESQKK